nr:PepSY-associated TM helix domain-containing protein [Comamonas koreensis]
MKKEINFRQMAAWLHTWCAVVIAWVLYFMFVTGTAGYFHIEISKWMQPERVFLDVGHLGIFDVVRMMESGLLRLNQISPIASSWSIDFPHHTAGGRDWMQLGVRWEVLPEPYHHYGSSFHEQLNPATGDVISSAFEPRATAGGLGLYRMHYALHYLPYLWAIRIVGVCTTLMLLSIITGVITHKKIFKDFFTFRPGKGQRSWLDAHNAISVMALPFFLMITYSGLVFFLFAYMPAGREILYGKENSSAFYEELFEEGEHKHVAIGMPAIPMAPLIERTFEVWGAGQLASITIERHEGEPPEIILTRAPQQRLDVWTADTLRFNADTGEPLPAEPRAGGSATLTQSVLLNLHEGNFSNIWGRWLYFIAGLLGCAMIGTGLVLWTVKRRKYHLGSGREGAEIFGVRLVENLNVATIAGLPLAVAGYFWANRLLPLDMADRSAWELHSLFALWLGTLFFALARPLARAWIELLWATCAAYALVPVVNALTTDRHLGRSLPEALNGGDWVFAGFDLTMLGLALVFAIMARKVQRRLAPKTTATAVGTAASAGGTA